MHCTTQERYQAANSQIQGTQTGGSAFKVRTPALTIPIVRQNERFEVDGPFSRRVSGCELQCVCQLSGSLQFAQQRCTPMLDL